MKEVIELMRQHAETASDKALLNLLELSEEYLPPRVGSAKLFIDRLRNGIVTPNHLVDSAIAYLAESSMILDGAISRANGVPKGEGANELQGQEAAIPPEVARAGQEAAIEDASDLFA